MNDMERLKELVGKTYKTSYLWVSGKGRLSGIITVNGVTPGGSLRLTLVFPNCSVSFRKKPLISLNQLLLMPLAITALTKVRLRFNATCIQHGRFKNNKARRTFNFLRAYKLPT